MGNVASERNYTYEKVSDKGLGINLGLSGPCMLGFIYRIWKGQIKVDISLDIHTRIGE